ncbi:MULTISPECIES: cell division protein FtsQ/DivIB [Halomonas]|uniref:cell division protein FtsQ/DivIB n=1 Tax=Halomonas TaxID=2745 RepID=UPI001C98A79A|nr:MULTISPECIES: cell division protein FtsQ/DivIB [Halomonas]MBY6208050.1 cell division protein FtsQ/DivIB [Halomonas sp. DP3Y7-2]MBY6228859.1 cell division protein FtsQ/DivIB [Halomonas sp. DP3Y7-1]MCA0917157.1 cell division protein FtsQ/DivIB [Halomonas denitrificans]
MIRRGSSLGIFLLVVLLGAGGQALWLWLDRPIERVSIGGELHHVDASYLKRQLAPLVQGKTWLSVDLEALREEALKVGWLKEVRIRREWPNALTFELEEQRPVARWNDDKLLNAEGEPFAYAPVAPPDGLPDMAGPVGAGAEVLAYFATLEQRLERMGLDVQQLRLEPRGAWRFQLASGVWIMLGRGDLEARLGRLEAAWRGELGSVASHIRYIDLRYPNGVSVAWHGETEPVDGGESSNG